jgi:putative nucleotidyltransferase with HDIG domain
VSPPIEGKTWEADSLLRIGRLKELEIVLSDASVSRRHAEIAFTDQGWVIRDLGSTNGTFINGIRVGRVDQKVRPRDHLQYGNLAMAVVSLEEERLAGLEPPSRGIQVQNVVQHSWERALEAVAADLQASLSKERFVALLRTGRDFSQSTSLDSMVQVILYDALAALGADRGVVLLVDETTTQLIPRAVAPFEHRPDGPAWYSMTLAQRAISRGESLLGRESLHGSIFRPAPGRNSGVNSIVCALLRSPRQRLGVIYLERGPHRPPFTPEELRLADALAASVSAGIESVGHFLEKERDLFIHTLTALAQAVELRDDYTGSHTQRVTDYALMIAEELQLSSLDRHYLQIGTPLHDIGKIGINDAILLKQGHLTDEEFTYMKSHTWKGAAILQVIPHLKPIIPIVRNHHERWDGTGYPDQLAGSQISCLGRIVAVADAFDAMTTDRPYRPGMPLDWAFEEIQRRAGTQFDPDCTHAFLRIRNKIEEMLHQQKLLIDTSPRPLTVSLPPKKEEAPPSNARRTYAIPLASLAMLRR